MKTCTFVAAAAMLLAACGGKDGDAKGNTPAAGSSQAKPASGPPSPAVAAMMLAAEPTGAVGVTAAKAKGPAKQVVVTGRIAATVPGYAVMTLMDLSVPYCGETNKEDHCKTPWDYCCETNATRTASSMLVEVRDANGKPLVTPTLGDLRLLDHVTAAGELVKDDHGNFTLIATGWHRKARPELPADLRWPQ